MLAGLTAGDLQNKDILIIYERLLFDESVYHLTAVFAKVVINE